MFNNFFIINRIKRAAKFKVLIIAILFGNAFLATAQNIKVTRVDPPYWFTLMNNPKLELCIYGKNIAQCNVSVNYPGVTLEKVNKVENPNYLFLDLNIEMNTRPGVLQINFTNGKKSYNYSYEIRSRILAKNKAQGINTADLIYLIMPDRFANGDSINDVIKGMNEQGVNRDSLIKRHGGDLMGIIKNLPYLKFLGITSLRLTPILESNQYQESYNGYGITDHYKIDPRFGDMDTYMRLVTTGHNVGIKTIFDVVLNHVGDQHWFIKDLPSQDWIHQWPQFTKTNSQSGTLMDLYASDYDSVRMTDGWLAPQLPDLNQKNPFLANYLIQNSIWWIENTGIDGFMVDAYTYTNLEFTKNWSKSIMYEYPKFSIFTEADGHAVANQSYFTQNKMKAISFEGEAQGVTDFQLYYAINDALNQKDSATQGISNLYHTLTADYIYKDASNNIVFVDNQKVSRYFSAVGQEINKWKMGLVFTMTTRGIPMIYYGTELLMKNNTNVSASTIPIDFAGGWDTDSVNKFKSEGRTATENEAYNFISKLANWRQNRSVIKTGKLMQFVPEDGVYVYFRYNKSQTIMVVMNSNGKEINLDTKRFAERMSDFKTAIEITTGINMAAITTIKVPAKTAYILELK